MLIRLGSSLLSVHRGGITSSSSGELPIPTVVNPPDKKLLNPTFVVVGLRIAIDYFLFFSHGYGYAHRGYYGGYAGYYGGYGGYGYGGYGGYYGLGHGYYGGVGCRNGYGGAVPCALGK